MPPGDNRRTLRRMTTRRNFIRSLIAAVALAPVLCGMGREERGQFVAIPKHAFEPVFTQFGYAYSAITMEMDGTVRSGA